MPGATRMAARKVDPMRDEKRRVSILTRMILAVEMASADPLDSPLEPPACSFRRVAHALLKFCFLVDQVFLIGPIILFIILIVGAGYG
jgi:hypothetical protein